MNPNGNLTPMDPNGSDVVGRLLRDGGDSEEGRRRRLGVRRSASLHFCASRYFTSMAAVGSRSVTLLHSVQFTAGRVRCRSYIAVELAGILNLLGAEVSPPCTDTRSARLAHAHALPSQRRSPFPPGVHNLS